MQPFIKKTFLVLSLMLLISANSRAEEGHHDSKDKLPTMSEIVQEFCPVQTENLIEPDIYIEYEGEQVYFCCNMCRKKFLANPEEYLEALPQFAGMIVKNNDDHGAGHDNTTGHGQPEGWGRAVRFLGKFHPLVVHFPIALILVAALGEILVLVTRKSFFTHATRFCLMIAALAAVVTVALGWAAGTFATYTGQLAETLTFHRWLGTASGIFIIIVAILSETVQRKNHQPLKIVYRIALFTTAGLVGATGHFGAMLIFGWNHFVW